MRDANCAARSLVARNIRRVGKRGHRDGSLLLIAPYEDGIRCASGGRTDQPVRNTSATAPISNSSSSPATASTVLPGAP